MGTINAQMERGLLGDIYFYWLKHFNLDCHDVLEAYWNDLRCRCIVSLAPPWTGLGEYFQKWIRFHTCLGIKFVSGILKVKMHLRVFKIHIFWAYGLLL